MRGYCRPLKACKKEVEVGGKAANLGFLIRRKMPVPPGFAVTHRAFERFCEANILKERISGIQQRIDFGAPDSVRRAADEIHDLVLGCEIPQAVWRTVLIYAQDLQKGRIIVRSSAVGEDSKEASFAGQLDSVMAWNTPETLRNALLRCWASFWSERSLCYQKDRGVRLAGMGVVIQELVDSKVAGVLFTRSPDSKCGSTIHEDRPILIEYVFGQGEELVSGRQNPGRIVASRTSDRWEKVTDPENKIPGETDFSWLSQLKRHALGVEKIMGYPQDIEWAVDSNQSIFLLQSRPIIQTGSGAGNIQDKVLWSNVNVNENYPDPISPLLYSIALRSYYFYFLNLGRAFGVSEKRLNSMEGALSAIIGTQGGRMYYNLTNIYRVICVLPFGKKVSSFFDSFIGVNEPLDSSFKDEQFGLTFRTVKEIAEVARMGWVTLWTFVLLPWRIRSLERGVDRHLAACADGNKDDEESPDLESLRREFQGFLDIRFHQWRKAALADVAAMFTYGLLKSLLERTLGKEKGETLHTALLKGIPHIISSGPPQEIWELAQRIRSDAELEKLFRKQSSLEIEQKICREGGTFPEFRSQLDRFLIRWGFRCSGELMLTVPNFREKPAALFDILKGYIEIETESPELIIAKQEKERKEILKAIRPRMNFLFWVLFKVLLTATHQSIGYRERVRMKQAALYARFRQTVLGLGRFLKEAAKIEDPADIFFLKYREIEDFLGGTEMPPSGLSALIGVRKDHFQELSQLNPPDYLLLSQGEDYDGSQAGFQSGKTAVRAGRVENALYGVGACGGRVEGKARVLESVLEAHRLNVGEILVTRQTDPGWGPVFPLIKGLVMERGGMLSHGAIIAREYGIPAVVGIPKVTQRVTSGQMILVDGDEGYVKF